MRNSKPINVPVVMLLVLPFVLASVVKSRVMKCWEVMGMAKIYVFSNVKGGGEGIALAMADDGHVLASHYCSNEQFAKLDLGMSAEYRDDRREAYAKHYPDGYEMEFVPARDVATHPGLAAAYKLNQALAAADEVSP